MTGQHFPALAFDDLSLSVDSNYQSLDMERMSIMRPVLHNWILIGSNAYDEYTYVSWLDRNVYRRTVDLTKVCLL